MELTKAIEVPIFDADGIPIDGYKGIADEDEKNIYNIVSKDYVIVQHDDVTKQTIENLNMLGTPFTMKSNEELNDGGRLRMVFDFPELKADIGNDKDTITMQLTVDNSYDSTTGLRYEIGVFRLACLNGMIIGEKYATYYHKHTKGIQPDNIKRIIMNGCDIFKNKIVENFNKMVTHSMAPVVAIQFFEKCIEEKVIAIKYL